MSTTTIRRQTVWSYGTVDPLTGERIDRERWSFGGVSGGDPLTDWTRDLERQGHAITTPNDVWRPVRHHVIGCGVGHDDAAFAESGRSMAAFRENDGRAWWDDLAGRNGSVAQSIAVRDYLPATPGEACASWGCADAPTHTLGAHGMRVCEFHHRTGVCATPESEVIA